MLAFRHCRDRPAAVDPAARRCRRLPGFDAEPVDDGARDPGSLAFGTGRVSRAGLRHALENLSWSRVTLACPKHAMALDRDIGLRLTPAVKTF